MAEQPADQTVPRTWVSAEEIDEAIGELRRRQADLNRLDVTAAVFEGSGQDESVRDAIRNTIREVFGPDSPEYTEHRDLRIWAGPVGVGMSKSTVVTRKERGVVRIRELLEGFISGLEEEKRALAAAPRPAVAEEPREPPARDPGTPAAESASEEIETLEDLLESEPAEEAGPAQPGGARQPETAGRSRGEAPSAPATSAQSDGGDGRQEGRPSRDRGTAGPGEPAARPVEPEPAPEPRRQAPAQEAAGPASASPASPASKPAASPQRLAPAAGSLHPRIGEVAGDLFSDGYPWEAVFAAGRALVNYVKEKSGCHDLDGIELMRTAFTPSDPILALNDLRTQVDRTEQEGLLLLFEGVVLTVRDPGDSPYAEDTEHEAAVYLSLLSMLAYRVQDSQRLKKPGA